MTQSIHDHCNLISIYLDACSPAGVKDAPARLRTLGQGVARCDEAWLRQSYARNARLLSLVLNDPGLPDAVKLPEYLGPIRAEGQPGISVVTSAMNRTDNLLRALPSWLRNSEVSEVVIVDWSSQEPVAEALAASGMSDPRIRVVRVNNAPRWILSYAFNIGFRVARYENILKLDADIVLSSDFLARNGLPGQGGFIAGNWRTVAEEQAHVNGFFFAPRAALANVGGFNEFITTYGWDDDDIYTRLERAGFQRRDVASDTIHHLPHSDAERTGNGADDLRPARETLLASTRFMIQRNRILAEKMPVWTGQMALLPLIIEEERPDGMTLSIAGEPDQGVPDDVFNAVTEEMLRELMAWDYGPAIRTMDPVLFDRVMERPLSHLSKEAFLQAGAQQAPAVASGRARLFIDAQHGLGNRLRAIGSAAAIADATGRELVIVWQPDDHCDCRFSDLFAYDGAVVEQSFINDATNCDIHNYMPIEGGTKDAPIRTDGTADIYARAAFVLNSPHSTWATENRFIQSLTPVEAVQALVRSVRNPNDVSAHVRMEAGPGRDHNSYDRPENWLPEDHALIHTWRERSHFSHFMKRLDVLTAEGRANHIFIAADLPETYQEFSRTYGDRVVWLPRSLYDRSAEQMHYALADAILLSRAPLLLGSTWSSFSELAMRLAPGGIRTEMSGKDF